MLMCRAFFCLVLVGFVFDAQSDQDPEKVFRPATKNENGAFMNEAGVLSQGGIGVRVPFLLRRLATYFRSGEGAPEVATGLNENLHDGLTTRASVTWVGHSTLLVQMAGVNFLTDPIWSDWPSPVPYLGPRRYVPPGLAIEALPPIDFVLISHNHFDHLDLPTLKLLAERDENTLFLVPLENDQLLKEHGIDQVKALDWGDSLTIKGYTIHCLPAQHWSKRTLNDTNRSLWASWAVTGVSKRFYFAGDTGYFPGFTKIGDKLGPFDLAAMPIGAYKPVAMMRSTHMNPEEAVQASIDIKAKNSLAIHFGTFDLSDEPLDEPPKRFKAAAGKSELGIENRWVLKVGEQRQF